ncbi:hypothetical protein [Streptosporangium carneum]|uniref:Uncharacterized protein n=1 Tax=Streptosporangium carneum TaxID=47481 RepID=A0A9W6I9B4_9ACTN|nr:hypothetical protein [Streptosporangium carneum]GLK14167.1 hypothetical protein GCM10017600_75790 [Streptosporangium carneum]
MACVEQPIKGPFSLDAPRGDTNRVERTAVVVVHHLAAATRLMDIVPLVEPDRRVQLVYTVPPSSVFADGAHDFLRDTGALVMPWSQATEVRFDLAFAAGHGLLERLRAPVMTFFHGAGPYSYVGRREGDGLSANRAVTGFGLQGLVTHGRVIPTAIMVSHDDHHRLLAAECPDAAPAAIVAGDLCFDRLLASRSRRTAYRNALGAGPGQRVVVVSSHYGAGSLLWDHPDLLSRLAAELPAEEYRIVVVLHPNIWVWHGRKQVRAWFRRHGETDVVLLPPEEGWRGALVGADLMIGDRGSLACYGAALGLPVTLIPHSAEDVVPGSQFALLGEVAPRLDVRAPLAAQLDSVERHWSPADADALRDRLTSVPGDAARLIRQAMYRLLRLPEPTVEARAEAVPLPRPLTAADR